MPPKPGLIVFYKGYFNDISPAIITWVDFDQVHVNMLAFQNDGRTIFHTGVGLDTNVPAAQNTWSWDGSVIPNAPLPAPPPRGR